MICSFSSGAMPAASSSAARAARRPADHDRMQVEVLGREHRRRHHALEVGRHLEAQAVEQGRADVGDPALGDLRALGDAGAVGEEHAVRMVRAGNLGPRLDDRQLVLDRDETEVAQHQQQIGRVVHRLAGEHVFAQVDLGDDALAGGRILQVLEVADQALAQRLVLLRLDAGLARVAGDADVDAVARRGAAVGDRALPVEVGEHAVFAAPAGIGVGQLLPLEVALLVQVGVDAHHLGGAGEAVVGGKKDLDLGAGGGDQLLDEAVELAEVVEAEHTHALVVVAQLACLLLRVDVQPGLVLQLVDAVEHHRHQLWRLLAQQVIGDAEPLHLARQVVLDPVLAVVRAELLHRLLLLLEVPGQLLRVEVGDRLQPVVEIGRCGAAAQVPPGDEAGHHEAVQVLRRRGGEREVESCHAPALPPGDGPDGLDAAVARVVEGHEDVFSLFLGPDEVEDPVVPGRATRHQRHPGGRGERIGRRAQLGARAFLEDLRQEGHHQPVAATRGEIVEDGERRAVHADEESAYAHGASFVVSCMKPMISEPRSLPEPRRRPRSPSRRPAPI